MHENGEVNLHIKQRIGVDVGRRCRIQRAIIDKGVRIPPETEIGLDREHDLARGFTITESGLVVIGRGEQIEPSAAVAGSLETTGT